MKQKLEYILVEYVHKLDTSKIVAYELNPNDIEEEITKTSELQIRDDSLEKNFESK